MNTKPYRIYKGLAGGALVVLLVLALVLTLNNTLVNDKPVYVDVLSDEAAAVSDYATADLLSAELASQLGEGWVQEECSAVYMYDSYKGSGIQHYAYGSCFHEEGTELADCEDVPYCLVSYRLDFPVPFYIEWHSDTGSLLDLLKGQTILASSFDEFTYGNYKYYYYEWEGVESIRLETELGSIHDTFRIPLYPCMSTACNNVVRDICLHYNLTEQQPVFSYTSLKFGNLTAVEAYTLDEDYFGLQGCTYTDAAFLGGIL